MAGQSSPRKAGNKEKQASGGNWGHPRRFVKSITDVSFPDDDAPEAGKKGPRRKRKRARAARVWSPCPFCGAEMRLPEEERVRLPFLGADRKECECGAVNDECPACHSRLGVMRLEGEYRHNASWNGCGFRGRRLARNPEKRPDSPGPGHA
jgi:hypothetical protein